MLRFGFEKLALNSIFATCEEENKASEKVLVSGGMSKSSASGSVIRYVLSKQTFEEKQKDNSI